LALGAVRKLPGSDVTEKLIDEFSGFEPAVQALLIKAMLDRNDPNLRKGLQVLAGSNDEQVRVEALKALGSIGNASSVAVLLRGAARGGDESAVALTSLRMLEGDGVDEAIISGMKSTKGKVRAELIGVIEDRRYQGASAALLVEAAGNDKAVAIASYKALKELAGDNDVAALVSLLVKADDKQVRDNAERAVASAAGRIKDPHRRADDVLSMLTATGDIETQCSLLRVLGRIGNDKAFEALRAAVADKNAKVRDVAVRQLADWKDSRAINILSMIAGETSNETHRVLAMRGYVRLAGADTDMSQKTKVGIYRKAMDSAKGDNEKKLILAGLANVKHPEALDVIVDFIDIESVRDEAVLGTLTIAKATAGADPGKARAAALKVRQVATDEKLRAQADNLIKAIDGFGEQTNPIAGQNAVSIFDGKTFSGWEGNLDFFRIQDGAIVGGTLKNKIPRNEFLCTTKEYDNFELRLNVKLLGNPVSANAGIQIRSRRIPNHNEMIGYQADMGQHYWGCLYDESRRRKVLANADRTQPDKILKPAQWNEYVIRCEGKRIRLWINGHQTVDYTEPDDSIEQKGLIGLQIHSGPPSEAWYKDIMIKRL
jgi:HEAT repeat protein